MNSAMKRKEMAMLRLFTASFILLAALVTDNAWAAPQLEVEQPTFDFGKVLQGETVRHTFSFSNAGDEPLQIKNVSSSCGCTAALVSAKTLAPGESGEVQANFDSTRFRGAVTKTISLYSNDPAQPVVRLQVNGVIKVALSVVPDRLNLGQITSGIPVTAKLILQNHADEDLPLDEIHTSSSDLVAELSVETLPAGKNAVIDVQLTPRSAQKRFRGYVIIPAKGPLKSDLRIPVHAGIRQQTD
jgi:hypothetical protein